MSLPRLLRSLAASASSRDSRGVGEAMAELGRHSGWSSDVAGFIGRMTGSDAQFIRACLAPAPQQALAGVSLGLGGTGGTLGYKFSAGSYPMSAAAMASRVGFGTWDACYLCDEQAGSLVPTFGSPTLTVVSTPTYNNDGPLNAGDRAIGFDSTLDAWDDGNVFAPLLGDDLAVLWVTQSSTITPGAAGFIGKSNTTPRWEINTQSNKYNFVLTDGTHAASVATAAIPRGWHVGMAAMDRGTGRVAVATRTLSGAADTSGLVDSSAVLALTNAGVNFRVGGFPDGTTAPTTFTISAIYITCGAGKASGIPANIATALSNFVTGVFG